VRVVGVGVESKDPKRPTVHVVMIDDGGGANAIVDSIDLRGDDEPLPHQLRYAAKGVRTFLRSANAERVVVRQTDYHPQARMTTGRVSRILVEGAVVSAAVDVVPDTRLGTGKEAGGWFGGSKADVEAAAKALVAESGLHKDFAEAASAALSGIALGP
jgi:hypothetical protein